MIEVFLEELLSKHEGALLFFFFLDVLFSCYSSLFLVGVPGA